MSNVKPDHRLATLVLLISAASVAVAQTPGSSPANPAPAGLMVSGIIECGQGYTSHELYDMKVTLMEVLRGEEAWKRIKEADSSNKQPEPGLDYVLARVRFEYRARGTPGLCVHQLIPDQFSAYSPDGDDYRPVPVVTPKPEMRKALKSGEIHEGWLVFTVAQQDKVPLMSYSADSGGAIMHGGGKWFLLR
jgi:hypothetical protein